MQFVPILLAASSLAGLFLAFKTFRDAERSQREEQGDPDDAESDRGDFIVGSAPNFGGDIPRGSAGTRLDDVFQTVGEQYGVDWRLLKAVASVESSLRPDAYNPDDPSYGLMQILCTGDGEVCENAFNIDPWPVRRQELYDPQLNVSLGAQILGWNIRTYGLEKGVAVYNKWSARNESAPFSNQRYVDAVFAAARQMGFDPGADTAIA